MPEPVKEARRVALIAALEALEVEHAASPKPAASPNTPGPSDRSPGNELEYRNARLREVHASFDVGRSGSIERGELIKHAGEVRRRLSRGARVQGQGVDSLFRGMDLNANHGIDEQKFVSLLEAALPNDRDDFDRIVAFFKEVAAEATAEKELMQQTAWSRYLRSFASSAQLTMLGLQHTMATSVSGPGLTGQLIDNIRAGGVKGKIMLSKQRVDDAVLALLVAAIVEDGAAIEELDLTDNYITDAGAACLAQMFSHDSCHIYDLDLSGNHISQVGATELVAAAQGNMTVLRLERNQIGDVKGIAKLISGGGCDLEVLALADNAFLGNESCSKALWQAVTENSTLTAMNVSPNLKLQQSLRNQFNKPPDKREVSMSPTLIAFHGLFLTLLHFVGRREVRQGMEGAL